MLEGNKNYLTKRITIQKDAMSKYNGDICPRIQLVLEKKRIRRLLKIGHLHGMVMMIWPYMVWKMEMKHMLSIKNKRHVHVGNGI